jgi:hypothetical protein
VSRTLHCVACGGSLTFLNRTLFAGVPIPPLDVEVGA